MTWNKAQALRPSAGLVQQHFVKSRLAELHRTKPQLVEKVLEVIKNHDLLKHLKLEGEKLVAAYDKINKALQAAELTINFNSSSWFATENNYDSYTQMYERNIQADGTARLVSDGLNPADVRARADDVVTFPGIRQTTDKLSGQKRLEGPAAKFVPGTPGPAGPRTGQGLRPGVQTMDRLMTQMRFGECEVKEDTNKKKYAVSNNPYFNPHTKQVFAALNYGRRPQGSETGYGKSFLVLNPQLKTNALYFGQDTFYVMRVGAGAESQVPYVHLATILAAPGTSKDMVTDIIKSCYLGMTLTNRTSPTQLLEAHIFSALPFKGNLATVVIPLDEKHTVYGENALKFATKHGAKIQYTCVLKK
jgi:hypothetical protein